MGKKRKTRQQKIISRLKREIAKQEIASAKTENNASEKSDKAPDKKEVVLKVHKRFEDPEKLVFTYAPELIKKDLIKTAFLSIIFLTIIIVIKACFHS